MPELARELLRRVTPVPAAAEGIEAPRGEQSAQHAEDELAEHMVFRPAAAAASRSSASGQGSFAVRGKGIERLLQRYDVENEDAMAYVEERLRRIGVLKALETRASAPGTRSRSPG